MSLLATSEAGARARLATAATLVMAAPAAASAATYHVDPAGDDSGAGDEAAPWQTLQHAADSVAPGDEVIVHEGRYVGFEIQTSGTETEPIVFSAEPGAVIDRETPLASDGINVHQAAHIVIEGFEITGASRAGIRGYECDNVVIRDNKTDQNGIWGVLSSFCDDITIEGNETSRSEIEHGIYVGNTCENPTVVGNVVWGNYENGIHLNGDRHAGGGAGFVSGARVEGNIIYGNGAGGGSAINGDGLRDSLIANNVVYDNAAAGVSLYSVDGGGGSTGNVVAHNTIVMPAGSRPAIQIRDGSTDNTVLNNIFVHEDDSKPAVLVDGSSLEGLLADFNAGSARYDLDDAGVIPLADWYELTGHGGSSFEADPEQLFADPAGGDFSLAPDSLAAGAGSPDVPEVAAGGSGGAPDLGAVASSGGASGQEGEEDLPDPIDSDPISSSDDFPQTPQGGCGGGSEPLSLTLILVGLAAPRAGLRRIRLDRRSRR